MKLIITENQLRGVTKEIILENIKQGEDLFRKMFGKDIPKDNEKYNELRNLLVSGNQVGFMPILIKLFGENFDESVNFYKNVIIPNRNIIKQLPKQLSLYGDKSELIDDLDEIKQNSDLKKILNLIPSGFDKRSIENGLRNINKEDIDYFIDSIYPTKFVKIFTKKINRYKNDVDGLINYFQNVINDHKRGFTYENMLTKIKELIDIEILSSEDNEKDSYIFVHTLTNKGLKAVGSVSWCIWNEETFKSYTEDGGAEQYVLLDFNSDDINKSVIGFTIDEKREIRYAHLRDDENFISEAFNYLKSRNLLKKILVGHDFVKMRKKLKLIKNLSLMPSENTTEGGNTHIYREYFISKLQKILIVFVNQGFKEEYYGADLSDFLNQSTLNFTNSFINGLLKNPSNIKNKLVLFFRETPSINGVFYEDDYYTFKKRKKVLTVNLGSALIDELSKSKDGMFDVIIDTLKDLYVNGFDFDNETRIRLERMFKDKIGIDSTLKMMKIRKDKTNEPYSPLEFYHTKNVRDYKNLILDKISEMRKSKMNTLTLSEVKYAMEKGLEKTIRNAYSYITDRYYEEQLDYEDMEIYRYLGMIKELKNIITTKANNYGIGTLNSIEKSLYDYRSKI